ncbi:MAG: DUF1724 domain-containing protein [Methanobacteriaceae archaeon]|nr:DUF1724 domain-containing protein [Methanobacteriaceae archaeon]
MINTNIYEEVMGNELTYLLRSKIRFKIIINLYKKSLTLKELENCGLSYGSLLSNIKNLENKGYIISVDDKYHLTNSIKIKIENILYLIQAGDNIYNFDDYLNNHFIKSDKLSILSQIPLDTKYEIITNTPLNPYKVVNNFSKNMVEDGKIKCIFTHIHPEFQKVNTELKTSSELKILVSKEIQEYLISKQEFNSDNDKNIKIKTINPVKLSLTVTDKEVMFVLYNKDGTYDTNSAIISTDHKLILYGNRLFDEIEKTSVEDYIQIYNL